MPRVKQFDQEKTLQKAVELFWEKGYNATSLTDLTNTLNIGKGSFYDTFKGKRQLFEKAFEVYRVSNLQMLKTMLAVEPDVKKGIKNLLTALVQQGLADPDKKGCFAVNTTAEFGNCDLEIKSILKSHNKLMKEVIYGYTKNHPFKNGINAAQATSLLITFITGLNTELKVKDKESELMLSVDALLVLFE